MNQRDHREDNKQAESLSDLPVADEQADRTTGGALAANETLVGIAFRP